MIYRMPTLFIGHGNPMNAIADNYFTQMLTTLGEEMPKARAILCISSHWMTPLGTWITNTPSPKTIHDFHGFPKELTDLQYPAPSSPEIAAEIRDLVKDPQIKLDSDQSWGFDHGAWSILRHMYPKANVPILQLSVDSSQPFQFYFDLGQKLRPLRDKDILIIGTGNIVHNLRKLKPEQYAEPYPWAVEFDEWVKQKIMARDFASLILEPIQSESGKKSIPTPDHYLPLLYILGTSEPDDRITFEHEGIENGSISMRSLSFGLT